jgi:hypothetical protein
MLQRPARSTPNVPLYLTAILAILLAVSSAPPADTLAFVGAPAGSVAVQDQPEPEVGQRCPAWVHDRYTAPGPDGQPYAAWHPPTDPISGCWFGHEHGDDPTGSPALQGRDVIFGYAGTLAGADEAHVGYKVSRWDDVRHRNAPNHSGASVLMVVHQGSAGANRFVTPHHEVDVDYVNPRDGRAVHVRMLAPFGTLLVGCGANDPTMLLAIPQATGPGARQIAADRCFEAPHIPYEDWITTLYVGADTQGGWRAYVDPHFAIFNPNTYCQPQGDGCALAHSDERAGTGHDPLSPASAFKGTKRETYLNQVWVDNAGGQTEIWTDPFGRLSSPGAPGAIAQYVCTLDVRPQGNSAAFGADRVYDDGTVRAPN